MNHVRPMQNPQRGLTMIGFLFVGFALVMMALLAMKLVPAYMEFFSVKKIITAMGQESDLKSKSNGEIRSDFAKRADVSYVTAVKPEDLTIDRHGGGTPVISADYAYRTKLFGNVSLVVDFSAASSPNAALPQIE